MMRQHCSRRHWLQHALFGAGLLGFRAMASGIPARVLQNPEAFAQNLDDGLARRMRAAVADAQYLILSMSDEGEPINGNVPGMYLGQGFLHPTAPAMAETSFALGAEVVKAAAVWSTLSASTLQRSCFFHHATYHFAHGDVGNVHCLNGRVDGGEYMVSAFARALQPMLGTIQEQPMNICSRGGEPLRFRGQQQPVFSPTFLKSLLTTPQALSAYKATQALRDADLDRISQVLKNKRSKAQVQLLDAWATSQQEARALPESLLGQVSSLNDNSSASQLAGAVMLCQMKLAPVVVVHLPFGSDNHTDTDNHLGPGKLPREAAEHVASVAAIGGMTQAMAKAGLQDKITFATLSTFGRSNVLDNMTGRAHNGDHTCSYMLGSRLRPGVVGGAALVDINPRAMAIDSSTGRANAGGDIAFADTLAAFGKTLGMACGLSSQQLEAMIAGGKPVQGALVGA